MIVLKSIVRLNLTASTELPWACILIILMMGLSIRWFIILGPDKVALTLTGLDGEPFTLNGLRL